MVILFALWFILQWQFPTWLWIVSGFFYVISLRPKKKIKKQIPIDNNVLPLYLVLALIFGTDAMGNAILPTTSSVWVVIGISLGSILIRIIVASPIIKNEFSKTKNNNKNITITGDGVIVNDEDEELKLHIEVTNKEKNKSSNFKVNLENGFISDFFLKKMLLKGIKENYVFKDDSGQPLFNIFDIYDKAKKNPEKGEVLSIDNEKVAVVISIK
mgnify:CR=1 FL=1